MNIFQKNSGREAKPCVRSIGEVLKLVRRQLFQESGRACSAVIAEWPKIVGVQTAGRTSVTGFRKKALYVKVASPALLQELSNFKKESILIKLQTKYPEMHIRDIKFTV